MPVVLVELNVNSGNSIMGVPPKSAENLSPDSAISTLTSTLSKAMAEQLKALLETRHLYQKVVIDPAQFVAAIRAQVHPVLLWNFDELAERFLGTARFTPAEDLLLIEERTGIRTPVLTLLLSNLKVFCRECDAREVAKPVSYVDVTNQLAKLHMRDRPLRLSQGYQLFLLTYQCQRCVGTPQGFLVRRQEWQLILEGRSPMEHIEVAAFIPKAEQVLFRDAIIAFNTGKILAALFYLRAFIEAFARRQTGMKDRATGEDIMEAYAGTLPTEHRDHMPSLRQWYDRLSDALHTAREDAKLFEDARAEVEKHFDIRRVFDIK